jgi:RNA polymerase sigma-70 factor, ECF subfamily
MDKAPMDVGSVLLGSRRLDTLEGSNARDLELLLRIRGGDDEAFRGLFGRYAPTAKALAMRVVRQGHLAEEIVQEAFLAVWRNPQGYDEQRGSVRSWLMGMVHHRAVDMVRREEAHRRRAEHQVVELREEQADHADEVVEEIGRPQEQRLVRAALAELPPVQREVIELMYFGGFSQSRVAELTGLPLGTVKSRTLLGMRRLRAALEGIER